MITLEVRPDIARHLRRHASASHEVAALTRWAAQAGTCLEPVFPGVKDPRMASFYTVQVSGAQEANRLLHQFQGSPAIVGAYIKPPDELP